MQFQADRQLLAQTGQSRVQIPPQAQDVAALDHRHRQADGIVAQVAHARRRRLDGAAPDPGDIAQAEQFVTGPDRHVGNRLHRVEGAGDAQVDAVAAAFEKAGRNDRVLGLQRRLQLRLADPQTCQLGLAELDVDALVLDPEQLHLGHVGQTQQARAQALGPVFHRTGVKAVTGQREQVAEGVAEFVVEEWPDRLGRQGMADIGHLLADLVQVIVHFPLRHVLADLDEDLGFARPGPAADAFQVAQLFQFFLDPVGDLARHRLRIGARPQRVHHHHLEGERRILGLAQRPERQHAGDAGQQHQVQHQAAVAQRPLGKIETACTHGCHATAPVIANTGAAGIGSDGLTVRTGPAADCWRRPG